MTGRAINPLQTATPIGQSTYKNCLIAGCSFCNNGSAKYPETWPYYLRDLLGFNSIIDCSQGGAGDHHVYNTVINEIETNGITPNGTCVIIMWPSLDRINVIGQKELLDYFGVTNPVYQFDAEGKYISVNLWRTDTNFNKNNPLEALGNLYGKTFDLEGQIIESCLHIIGLYHYLKNKHFKFVFTPYRPIKYATLKDQTLVDQVKSLMDPVEILGKFADDTNGRISATDWHPTKTTHLEWTKSCLIPYLVEHGFASSTIGH